MLESAPEVHPMITFLRAALVLCTVVLLVFPHPLSGQGSEAHAQAPSSPLQNAHDIEVLKKALLTDSSDLEEVAHFLKGTELEMVLQINEKASQGAMELDAAIWFVTIYDSMECEPDRQVAKTALSNRLGFYSQMLGLQADQAVGDSAFTKVPTIALSTERVKNDLRAGRAKLEEIAASLK